MGKKRKPRDWCDYLKLPLRFAASLYFQIPVALVLLGACVVCSIYIFYGHDWHKGEMTPDPSEYKALWTFWALSAAPAFIVIVAVFSTTGFAGRLTRERTSILQGVISVVLLSILCIMLCYTLRQIVIYEDYAMPRSSSGMIQPWDETHPWHMRFLPRIQGLCTFYGWLLTIFLSLGLFPVYRSNWEEGAAEM